MYCEHGMFPNGLGPMEQPASLMAAISVADHARASWEVERREHMERESKRKAKPAKRGR